MWIINPGTGPVPNATAENADQNIKRFVQELGLDGVTVDRKAEKDRNGRFCFLLNYNGRTCEVDVPGILFGAEQDHMTFPRLYVDGSSWFWGFALSIAHNRLANEES